MSDLAYLNGGERITAAGMNILFAELDRKTAYALDEHNLLYLLGTRGDITRERFAPYLGVGNLATGVTTGYLTSTSFFGTGPQPITGYWGTWSYDHTSFERALAATAFYSGTSFPKYSVPYKWAQLEQISSAYWTEQKRTQPSDNNLFDKSLEAHRKTFTAPGADPELYWVKELSALGPSKLVRKSNYGVAELMFEGGILALDFPANWDKYNFYRIHNCNSQAITVTFKNTAGVSSNYVRLDGSISTGTSHAVTVPGYGSRCVRRTGVNGTYYEGFKYFQRFISGDPRLYQHGNPSNNVTWPSVVIPFVNHVLSGLPLSRTSLTGSLSGSALAFAPPTVILDPHVRAPLPADYAALYGNPASDATALGDVLTHKGDVLAVTTAPVTLAVTSAPITFTSINSLAGFAVQEAGDELQIKRSDAGGGTVDFVSLSTNLLCTGVGGFIQHPVVDGGSWFTIPRVIPAHNFSSVDLTAPVTKSASYYSVTAGGGLGAVNTKTISIQSARFTPLDTTAASTLRLRNTLATVKAFGGASRSPVTAQSSWSSAVAMTSSGFVLNTTQTIPVTYPFESFATDTTTEEGLLSYLLAQPIINPMSAGYRGHITCDGSNFVIKRSTVWTGYGWPDVDNWFYTGVFTPRTTRTYSDRPSGDASSLPVSGDHPDFTIGEVNTDGRDVIYKGKRAPTNDTEIAILSPWNGPSIPSAGGTYPGALHNNDVVHGAVKNHLTPGYWNAGTGAAVPVETNRKRCFANRIFYAANQSQSNLEGACYSHFAGQPDAADMKRFWRMEMAVEHYNNLAAKVNSMTRFRPLNWIDHGVIQNGTDQTVRYRLQPNQRGLWDQLFITSYYLGLTQRQRSDLSIRYPQRPSVRPSTQFASFVSGSSLASVVGYSGIPVLNVNDLPSGFVATSQQNFTIETFTITGSGPRGDAAPFNSVHASQASNGRIRPDLAAITDYKWVSTAAVRALAETRGYKFIFAQCGAGLDLLHFNAPEFEIVRYAIGQKFIQSGWIEFVPNDGGSGAWIAGNDGTRLQAQEMKWADTCYFVEHSALFKINGLPEVLRRVNFRRADQVQGVQNYVPLATARNPAGGEPGSVPLLASYTDDLICRSAQVVKSLSAGITDNSSVVTTSIPYFKFAENFSETSADSALATANTGDGRVLPFTAEVSGARRAQLWADFTTPFPAV